MNSLHLFPPAGPAEALCYALSQGVPDLAQPFRLETLFAAEGLLGEKQKALDVGATFFKVPAPVYLCDEVTSTFAVARALVQSGHLPPWGAVLAATQTAGRGQLSRRWQSPRGNLYVTFRLPDAPIFRGSAAALAVGALLAQAFARLGCTVRLKWPNDLLSVAQAKVAGILLEEREGVVLVGVGVNLSVLPDAQLLRRDRASPAGLLLQADGKNTQFSPFGLWQALVVAAISEYNHRFAVVKADALSDLADPYLAWRGEAVSITDAEGAVCEGRLCGVGSAGELILLTSDGRVQRLTRGSLVRS